MSRVFGIVDLDCQLPSGTSVDTSCLRTFSSGFDDHPWPVGDSVIFKDPQSLIRCKILERHTNPHCCEFTEIKGPVFAERHCIKIGDRYHPYMLKVIDRHTLATETYIFPKHIETIKSKVLNKDHHDHETIASEFVRQLMQSGYLDVEASDAFADHYDIYGNIINGIGPTDRFQVDRLNRLTHEAMEMSDNIHTHRYASDFISDMFMPSICGRNTIDTLTAKSLIRPLYYNDIVSIHSNTWLIDMTRPKQLVVNPNAPCQYMPDIYSDIVSEIYRILSETPVTDIDLRYILSKGNTYEVDINHAFSRYPIFMGKEDIQSYVINNLGLLLHAEGIDRKIDSVRVMKTFLDEVLIEFWYKNTLVDQWYWDMALIPLCSDSVIVWP